MRCLYPAKQLAGDKKRWLCVCVAAYLHKLLCVLMELFQYRQRLFRKAVFKNALDDSAAVRVSGEGKDLRSTECTPLKVAREVR